MMLITVGIDTACKGLPDTARGIVSVNAYEVLEGITYPLLFKVFKLLACLKVGDIYKTKPQLAQ
ncbi:MAG: hypothetical protein ACM37W_02230 [Actinomycetota bacterium]